MLPDGTPSPDGEDWYGPYDNMGEAVELAIPKVSGPLWRETHPESESEPDEGKDR
jgi:hypothetical protein